MKRLCPNGFLRLFYDFNREYSRMPIDLDDMLDGYSCMRAYSEIREIYSVND